MTTNQEEEEKNMSELQNSNWFAIGLLVIGSILAVISVVGYSFNPIMFSSFSILVFVVISSIASYMLYNMIKIYQEIKKNRRKEKS